MNQSMGRADSLACIGECIPGSLKTSDHSFMLIQMCSLLMVIFIAGVFL